MKFEYNGVDCYIDGYLASALDSLVYNIKRDWDFCIVISGDRMVRVGKSVIAQAVCAYLSDRIKKYIKIDPKYNIDDVYFDSKSMVEAARKKPKYSINHYDEARESLAASKHMKTLQQDLMDFFNECGQLNQIFVLVLPDFFTLKEEMAVGRSEILINVFRKDAKKLVNMYGDGEKPVVFFQRGNFEFYSRNKKSYLYDKFINTRKKNYHAVKCDFYGKFTNCYPLGEVEYRKKKEEALARFEKEKEKPLSIKQSHFRNLYVKELLKTGAKPDLIARNCDISMKRAYEIIKEAKYGPKALEIEV